MAQWQLRFAPERIRELTDRYGYQPDVNVLKIGSRARAAGEYSYDDFCAVCEWKSPRSKSRVAKNTSEDVAEVTRIALSTGTERLRIEVLRCLQGVAWPTASVLLHLAHREPYPILDVRALWSWGFDKVPTYTFNFWKEYVEHCRELAQEQGVDMRTLDRALWQYSKEHQGPLR